MKFKTAHLIKLIAGLVIIGSACKPTSDNTKLHLINGKDLHGWHIDVPDMDNDSALISPFLVRNEIGRAHV